MADNSTSNNDDNMWDYNPNLGAAIFFTIIWLLTTVFHLIQMIYYRKWYCWALLMGCTWELVGFILRIVSIEYPTELKYYAPMLTLVILAPLWIAAFDYMSLGRLVLAFLPAQRCLGLSARKITLLFVLGDIGSFLVQIGGTMFLTKQNPTADDFHNGTSILIGGQALQLFLFGIFIAVAARFEINYAREFGRAGRERWVPFMRALNLSCVCICLRSIFRVAEFAGHYPGPLVTHEVGYYIMEALPMAITAVAFHFWHPGTTLVGDESSFRAQKKRSQAGQRSGSEDELELSGDRAV